MKNPYSSVIAIVAIAAILLLVVAAAPGHADDTFIAVLNGGQEVPPTMSPNLGNAHMVFFKSTRMLCFSISFVGPVGDIAAHFHAPARAGVNAPVLFPITPAILPVGSPKTGCVGPLSKQERKDLRNGLFYINIHSSANPGGEIRGQVLRIKGVK